jgi:Fe-S oxidoreductase
VRKAPNEAIIVADGTSCRHQIKDGTGRGALHVARVLAMSLDKGLDKKTGNHSGQNA